MTTWQPLALLHRRFHPAQVPMVQSTRRCVRAWPTRPAVREPCRDKPCSARAHAQASSRATHELRVGDEADADERGDAAAMPARSGEGWPSDPSRGCSAKHAQTTRRGRGRGKQGKRMGRGAEKKRGISREGARQRGEEAKCDRESGTKRFRDIGRKRKGERKKRTGRERG